jgi:hypothetical protein
MTKTDYHPSFRQPKDPSVLVWRYMDLAKLLSLLSLQKLYLRRLDLLPDKYEGVYPRRVRQVLAKVRAQHGSRKMTPPKSQVGQQKLTI